MIGGSAAFADLIRGLDAVSENDFGLGRASELDCVFVREEVEGIGFVVGCGPTAGNTVRISRHFFVVGVNGAANLQSMRHPQ